MATEALVAAGDVGILREAGQAGDRLVQAARDAGDAQAEGFALLLLGNLYSQPYLANRMLDELHERDAIWRLESRATMATERGPVAAADADVPALQDAVRQAAVYFAAACDRLSGAERGHVLYRLIQVRMTLDALGQDAPGDAAAPLLALAAEAATLLRGDRWLVNRLAMLEVVDRLGGAIEDDQIQPLLGRSLDDLVLRFGKRSAIDICWHLVKLTQRRDPRGALRIMQSLPPLIEGVGDDDGRRHQLSEECRLLWRAWAPLDADALEQAEPAAAADLTAPVLGDNTLDPRQRAAVLIGLALHACRRGDAARGLEALRSAHELAPLFTAQHEAALAYLSALLRLTLATRALTSDPYSLVDLVESGLEDVRRRSSTTWRGGC